MNTTPARRVHRVILFGGQGSPSIFSPDASSAAEADARSGSAGSIILSKCHAAFLEEIESLDTESQHLLAIETSHFCSPHDLVRPAVEYHQHPVLQATTIYLCQLLRYLAESLGQDGSFEDAFQALHVTAGFSSGIIPAAVVARSSSLDEFVTSGIQGFRLAFWIACRSHFWTLRNAAGSGLNVDNVIGSGATLSLVIRGLSRLEVEQRLLNYTGNQGPERTSQSDQTHQAIVVSAISGSGTISVSGPKADLCTFRSYLENTSTLTTAFAHVHGWYHGGEQLELVVHQVSEDLTRRSITFPGPAQRAKPIQSTLDGSPFIEDESSFHELPLWLTRHLLVHCVDWQNTAAGVASSVRSLLEREPCGDVEVISFGPSSGALFPTFEPLEPRVKLVDRSSFIPSGQVSVLSADHKDDVAIVGMSVQLPRGRGTEELWETLSQGLNAVETIPESRFQLSDFYAEHADKSRSMAVQYGAFLRDPFSYVLAHVCFVFLAFVGY